MYDTNLRMQYITKVYAGDLTDHARGRTLADGQRSNGPTVCLGVSLFLFSLKLT
jgi:hypothetical protein